MDHQAQEPVAPKGNLRIAVDIDGMLAAFPTFFGIFFKAMQKGTNTVGILTAESPIERERNLTVLETLGIVPDFYADKPDDLAAVPNGVFKAGVCNDLGIDILFDDFNYSDDRMTADFFTHNSQTTVFTSWAYRPSV